MSFTRSDTKSIKGIAAIMMLLDHILIQTKQPIGLELTTSISINGENLFVLLRSYCGTCVSIFMFLGGYGLFKVLSSNRSEGNGRILFNHILNILKSYWKVFLIFVPIGFMFFNNQGNYATDTSICNVFSSFNRIEFLENFLGISNSYNIEWWFIKPYIIALFVGMLFYSILGDNNNLPVDLFKVVLANILIINIIPEICWKLVNSLERNPIFTSLLMLDPITCTFLMGMVFAKYDIIGKTFDLFPRATVLKVLLGVVISLILFIFREFLTESVDWTSKYLDMIIVPCQVIAFFLIVQPIRWLWKGLCFIGNNSTNIWLTHSFFCYYYLMFARIVFASRNVMIDLAVLLIISLCSGMFITCFWKAVDYLYKKVDNVINKQQKIS